MRGDRDVARRKGGRMTLETLNRIECRWRQFNTCEGEDIALAVKDLVTLIEEVRRLRGLVQEAFEVLSGGLNEGR